MGGMAGDVLFPTEFRALQEPFLADAPHGRESAVAVSSPAEPRPPGHRNGHNNLSHQHGSSRWIHLKPEHPSSSWCKQHHHHGPNKSESSSDENNFPGYTRVYRAKSMPSFPDEPFSVDAMKGLRVSGLLPFVQRAREPTNVLPGAFLGLCIYLIVGIVAFCYFSDNLHGAKTNTTFVDAVYFSVVTMTTVGYGDLIPHTQSAKLFSCAFVFIGIAFVDLFLMAATKYLMEKQEHLISSALHPRHKLDMEEEEEEEEERSGHGMQSALRAAFCKMLPVLSSRRKNGHRARKQSTGLIKKLAWRKVYGAFFSLLVILAVGVGVLHFVEGKDLVDALYCACVTVTSVGYGDVTFVTVPGRVIAIFWVLASTLLLAQVFLMLAEARFAEHQHVLANFVLSRKTTKRDLEAADLDNDGHICLAEFILFKLKELGKVEQEDVESIMREFNRLDIDHDGQIKEEDVPCT